MIVLDYGKKNSKMVKFINKTSFILLLNIGNTHQTQFPKYIKNAKEL
jgi:hypothetical protein